MTEIQLWAKLTDYLKQSKKKPAAWDFNLWGSQRPNRPLTWRCTNPGCKLVTTPEWLGWPAKDTGSGALTRG
jgi:hypothetical protein